MLGIAIQARALGTSLFWAMIWPVTKPLLAILLAVISTSASQGGHWAFEPPERPRVPLAEVAKAHTAIDALLLHTTKSLNAPASRKTLVRRLGFDLLGLPPTLEERDSFLADTHPNAYERLTDRLLASPHYGEKMAQHWLDLARYADTTGHAADTPRTMWLYRDWVIEAMNGDLPYDQFTIEQLAGDLLPDATEAQKIATGFHRNSMQALGNNPRKEEFRVKGIVDRLDTTGQVWLGLSLGCAECHDHKHDPISTKEYYQLYALFNNVPHLGEKFEVRGPRMTVMRTVNGEPLEVQAQVMAELPTPRETYIHVRGNFEIPGDRVHPGLPALFEGPEVTDRLAFARWLVHPRHSLTSRVEVNRAWKHFFGRGLVKTLNDFGNNGEPPTHPRLLDWLAIEFQERGWSRKALHRQLVNSNIYRQSSASSLENYREDPRNNTYARGGRFRLPAEQIRDQMLTVSGLLVRELGGPSVFPPQPEGVGQFRDNTAGQWSTSEGANRFRRSLYTFWQRMSPHPSMTTFDAPSRERCTAERAVTNTPLQALVALNDPMLVEMRESFVRRLERVPEKDRIERAFTLTLSREPSSEERPAFEQLQKDHGWAAVATVLFNLDEFLTRE